MKQNFRYDHSRLKAGAIVLTCLFSIVFSLPAYSTFRIAWFVPFNLSNQSNHSVQFGAGNAFWKQTYKYTVKAADDLGVELVIVDFNRNRFSFVDRANEVASGKYGKIDAAIFYNFLNKGGQVLDIFERAKIPSMTIITNFIKENTTNNSQFRAVGSPRAMFKYWIGEFKTDDQQVGRDLMHYLARYNNENNIAKNKAVVKVIALAGERSHSASILRKKGLYEALDLLPNYQLVQLFEGSWSRSRAKEVLPKLIKRHGEINIIWCANDELALGALDGLKAKNFDLSKFVIGGVDWNSEALEAIEKNQLQVSFGGHFLQGAYALVLLYDYLNGVDFANDYGVTFDLNLQRVDKSSVHLYKHRGQFLALKQINFLKMSRYYQITHKQSATDYSFHYLDYLVNSE